jgi:hypothetical protein
MITPLSGSLVVRVSRLMEGPVLKAVGGRWQVPEDQVTRRERFQAVHPEVHIEYRPGNAWSASWVSVDGHPEDARALELKALLDKLEARFGAAGD